MKSKNVYLVIIFLLTASIIIFEITLSRLFSYMLSYHFAFLVISTSVFGLGIGEIIYAKYRPTLNSKKQWFFVSIPFIIIINLSLILLLPLVYSALGQQISLLLFIVLTTIPFLHIGIIFSFIFQQNPKTSYLLYTFDLLGSSAGALLSTYIFDSTSIFIIFSSITALLFILFLTILVIEDKVKLKLIAFFSILILVASAVFLNLEISIVKNEDKDLLRLMNNPAIETRIVDSKWSLFGKTDLVEFSYPDGSKSSSLFIDGAAGSEVIKLEELEKYPHKLVGVIKHFPAYFPFQFLKDNEKDTSLIIGPGGGIDIAANYFGKVNFIEAVEVNPSFIDLMRKYNSSTFSSKPNIKIIQSEGRNYVRKFKNKYDLIFLSIPITKSSRSTDFYILTENYLFTVEAIEDYMNALTEEGRLIFTMHSYEEIYRFISTYLEAKKRYGIDNSEALKHIYIISNGMKPVIIIKKKKFKKEEVQPRHFVAHENNLNKGVFYFPFIDQIKIDTILSSDVNFKWQMFDQVLYDVANKKYSFNKLLQSASINLTPTYDDSPFFYNFKFGLPDNMIILLVILIGIIIWLIAQYKKDFGLSGIDRLTKLQHKLFKQYSMISILLGSSYFLIQVYTFQILNLNLNSPTKSISVLLFLFLLGNGFGSLLSLIIKKDYLHYISIAIFIIIISSVIEYFLLLPILRDISSLYWLIFSIGIPAFLLGIPFPLLLKEMSKIKSSNGIALLLGYSSISGAAASSLSIIMALMYGFKSIIFLAFFMYVFLLYVIHKTKRQYLLYEV